MSNGSWNGDMIVEDKLGKSYSGLILNTQTSEVIAEVFGKTIDSTTIRSKIITKLPNLLSIANKLYDEPKLFNQLTEEMQTEIKDVLVYGRNLKL